MELFDKAKDALTGEKGQELKAKAQDVIAKIDDKAEELSAKEGVVGDIAGKAHQLLDKIDGD
jgi:hypothetical protein